ncbi:MAG: HD domain-containing protein [Lachnospiraceae bacterium]|nr:HD domain-containing protein [Lachnospiraceae bacterium]MBQ4068806.1 HD domain-containing protein [Lachnospiraceae bacterium]
MSKYNYLSYSINNRILEDKKNNITNEYACHDGQAIRRNMDRDKANLWRPAYIRDVEKIMHCPYYNRYTDKTQVFSFYKNDDISRRALHVQLVSRIARNIGRVLGLNEDLIEAIALGHDIGHTPFGHAGERFLNKLYNTETGRYFNHNVHSVRVLDKIFSRNISLQALDGILCHNGEFELKEYRPCPINSFEEFDKKFEECYVDKGAIKRLIPSTLEGCVVRICDMVAYLGKDRQDAILAKIIDNTEMFTNGAIGIDNAELINNLTVNILENSYGKDYIMLDEDYYNALKIAKKENYEYIYRNDALEEKYIKVIEPMFEKMYYRLLEDLERENKDSYIYTHHIDYINMHQRFYDSDGYEKTEKNQIVVDYIASMTDDYFMDLYKSMFPEDDKKIVYVSYFE